MAVKKKKRGRWQTGRLHWPGRRHRHDHQDEADLLTPLEETAEFKDSPQRDGKRAADTIRVDGASVKMPEHLVDDEREGGAIFRLEPVVLFLLALMLVFVALVAWRAAEMPPRCDEWPHTPCPAGKQ